MLLDISGKVESSVVNTLYEVSKVADALKISFFIIGAAARDFIFEYCYNVKSPRMTKDIDLGIKVASWEEVNNLSKALLSTGKFSKTNRTGRYIYNETLIDLVPFGPIADKEKKISWPSQNETILVTLGFEEAYQYAITVRLSGDPTLDIKLPTVPGLTIMKLISWHEATDRKKDAEDLLFILKNYEETGVRNRLYEKETHLLEEEDFEIRPASIRLLGQGMARIAKSNTLKKIKDILDRETDSQSNYNLIFAMVKDNYLEQSDEALVLLEKLKQGVFEEYSK